MRYAGIRELLHTDQNKHEHLLLIW